MYYAVFLFQQAGIQGTQASLLANGIQGAVLNVVTWVNMWYIDTWGRRRPMVIGAIGMGISMMLIGVIMVTKGKFTPPHGEHLVALYTNGLRQPCL
jgi:MFS family permease